MNISGLKGVEQCGQVSPMTTTLRNVLRDYSGAQILNEQLQNADDAGATVFKVLYDKRDLGTSSPSSTLLSPEMAKWMGPALYAFDDAVFQPDDFVSIQQVGDGLKRGDPTKTGQFGLGFNSVYHVTDVPMFLSGKNAVIFDPHGFYLPNRLNGLTVDLSEPSPDPACASKGETLSDTFRDQFIKPFEGIFGCDGRGGWSESSDGKTGTLFRLPFRSTHTIKKSKIKKSTIVQSLDELWKEIVEPFCHRLERRLLFLRSIEKIEIHVWEAGATSPICTTSAMVNAGSPSPSAMQALRMDRKAVMDHLRRAMSEEKKIQNDAILKKKPKKTGFFSSFKKSAPVDDNDDDEEEDDGTSKDVPPDQVYFACIAKCSLHTTLPCPIYSLRLRLTEYGQSNGKHHRDRLGVSKESAWIISTAIGSEQDFNFAASKECAEANLALFPFSAVGALIAERETGGSVAASVESKDEDSAYGPWKAAPPYDVTGEDDRLTQNVDDSARLYAALPTPIITGLPRNVQVDGRWELARDRNSLAVDTTGESSYSSGGSGGKGKDQRQSADALRARWNVLIANSVAPKAFARLIRIILAWSRSRTCSTLQNIQGSFQVVRALPLPTQLDLTETAQALLPSKHSASRSPLFQSIVSGVYSLLSDITHAGWTHILMPSLSKASDVLKELEGGGKDALGGTELMLFRGKNDHFKWSAPSQTLFLTLAEDRGSIPKAPLIVINTLAAIGFQTTDAPLFVLQHLREQPKIANFTALGCDVLSPKVARKILSAYSVRLSKSLNEISPGITRIAVVRELLSYLLSDISTNGKVAELNDVTKKVIEEIKGLPLLILDSIDDNFRIGPIGQSFNPMPQIALLNLEQQPNGDLTKGRGSILLPGPSYVSHFVESVDIPPDIYRICGITNQPAPSIAEQLWPYHSIIPALSVLDPI